MKHEESNKVKELLKDAKTILIIQADNPDGDSLGSALALEQIIHELGKKPLLYCGVDIPGYLKYMPGWDRVEKDIVEPFDLSIIVDTSSVSLLESMNRLDLKQKVPKKPCIVLDHHDVDEFIPFATLTINKRVVATGELIYEIAKDLDWELNKEAMNRIAGSIMSDSLGLVSEGTTPESIHIVANLVADGVSLAGLENDRRALMRKSPELIKYKGELLQRIEYFNDDRIAIISIPWAEIEKYSHSYNPSMLVIDDMRLTENTDIAIAFKVYKDGKVTAKVRSNYGVSISGELAKHFGGGGHSYASGFKIGGDKNKSLEDIKLETIKIATELLDYNKDNEV